jgi:hypothetical protein
MIRHAIGFLGALSICWSALPAPANGQSACVERTEAASNLKKKFSEIPVSMGLSKQGALIEVFASPAGTWSIIMTFPNGMSCIMAAGEAWEILRQQMAGAET